MTILAAQAAIQIEEESDEATERCADCGSEFTADDAIHFGGEVYCPSCVESCEDCGTDVPSVALEHDVCSSCATYYRTCYDCGDRTHVDNVTTVNGEYVCDHCLENGYTYCEGCGEYEPDDDRCHSSSEYVEDYSYKPYPRFHVATGEKVESNQPYFGVELETEAVNADLDEGASLVSSSLGDLVYLKSDGSLDDGFEIVTHPMSLAFAHDQDWQALDELATLGFRSWQTETCGIHVHVSRAGFKGKAHIWRFSHLLYRNADECQRFAGRSSSWARFDGQRSVVAKVLKRETPPERYVAVNLCNLDTIEVRMFRGSLKAARMLADIEFVAAAVEHTRDLTVPDVRAGALDWQMFRSYLAANSETYPNLVTLLARGGN
jgi:hypothetical protein